VKAQRKVLTAEIAETAEKKTRLCGSGAKARSGGVSVLFLLVTGLLLLTSGAVWARVTLYTDEAAYLEALANLGYSTFEEGFESDAVWGAVRSPGTVAGVVGNGIRWQSNHPATNGITTGSGAARTGNWGIYDPDHGVATGTTAECEVDVPPPGCFYHDGFAGVRETGANILYGVGGWMKTNTPFARINFILDNADTIDFENVPLSTAFLFFGVIDTTGFTAFEIRETEGKVGDQKFIFADDFTFGSGASPPGNAHPAVINFLFPLLLE
jgi:hypothetical protein